MRRYRICEACEGGEFEIVEAFAAEQAGIQVEVVVRRCRGCGGDAQATQKVAEGLIEEIVAVRQVA